MLPMLKAARNSTSSPVIPCCVRRYSTTSLRANGAKEMRRQRERTVGNNPPALDAMRIISESCGGSSRVLSSAFCDAKFINVAGSTIMIFRLPVNER